MNKEPAILRDDRYLEQKWGKRRGYLSDLRARGMGPAFLRLGPRCLRYTDEDIEAYEQAQRMAPVTSDFTAPSAPPRAKKISSGNSGSHPERKTHGNPGDFAPRTRIAHQSKQEEDRK
jgi:hypothetical protein